MNFLCRYYFILFFFTPLLVSAQPVVNAKFTQTPPEIDGHLNEEIWKFATPVTEFLQREPDNGEPASDRTEVYIVYDENALYVGFRCFDDPEKITAKELARDVSLADDDRVQIILDTYLDQRNGYWFQIGPRGSIGDAIVSENGAVFNKAWDGLWTGKARIHENGWDAEMEIPFKTMGFREGQTTWGMKLIRYIKSREESIYWPVANINSYGFQISDAGRLTGLENITQGIGLDLVPYGISGFSSDVGGSVGVLDAGFDAYYQVTPAIKSAITINTDFAQTEVDQQLINLTRFSLFYPEKRDFFLDGANYFSFGANETKMIPFFSRRIGLDSIGKPIPVLYGGKFAGQAGDWNMGAMYMKDQRNGWVNSHFGVTRISRNFGNQSQAGLIATYGNTLEDVRNSLIGFDVKLGTSQFRDDKNLALIAYGLKSFTKNISNKDLTFGAEVIYPNDFLYFRAGHMQIQENFIAGVGFVPRPGVKETYTEFLFGPRPNRWGILQVQFGGEFNYITGFNNQLLTNQISIKPLFLRFTTGDQIKSIISYRYEFLDQDFNVYKDYVIPAGTYDFWRKYFDLISAKRRRIWATSGLGVGGFFNGTRLDNTAELGVQVAVPLFVSGTMLRSHVILPEGDFVTHTYWFNINILFSPDITLYTLIQYNSQSDNIGWQTRFQWIIQPGREFFFVWNSITYDPLESLRPDELDARVKLKFTIRF